MGKHSRVAIRTDGHGTWQAECLGCGWKSNWTNGLASKRGEAKAIAEAKAHGAGR